MKNINQTYTSAETSINETKLPAIYGKLEKLNIRNCAIFDYGCGKYTEHIRKWCYSRNIEYLPYDPFNQTDETNQASNRRLWQLREQKQWGKWIPVYGVCSNVLNVIDSEEVIISIIDHLWTNTDGTFYTVYEGDKSGIGKVSKKDCYQRNEKRKAYEKFIKHYGFKTKYGMLIVEGA